jgi:O-antigen/teichoic acid export membrane protein
MARMKILDAEHPFLRPLWVRIGIVIVTFAWAVLEASLGETMWALVFGAIGSYCAWALLLGYKAPIGKDGTDG